MEGFAVLTAAEGLPDALLAGVGAVAGVPVRRLGPGGADLACSAEGVAAVRATVGVAADVNWAPAEGRAKRLLIADMDSTIITVECIDEIADLAGVGPQVARVTEAAMRGELDFEGALIARVALLEGLPEAALERVWRDRVRLSPGAEAAVKAMAARGAVTALVSGGFDFFADRVAAACGFSVARANRLEVVDGRLTGRVIPPILGREAKLATLRELCAAHGLTPADALAVGDGANDLAMVAAAGLGVAYRAKPALAEAAAVRLDRSDLTALLHLQGIAHP